MGLEDLALTGFGYAKFPLFLCRSAENSTRCNSSKGDKVKLFRFHVNIGP